MKENNLDLASNEPLWTPDDNGIVFVGYRLQAYNLGLIYCIQRPSQVYFWDMKNNSIKPISETGQSVHCPRFSPNGAYLVWLQNPVGGPHGQCVSLVGIDWSVGYFKPKVIIPLVDKPSNDDYTDRFPGLYCNLSERCWSSDSQCILVSSSWGFEKIGLIISVTESIQQCKPVIYKLPKLKLTSEQNESSLTVLDVYEDILMGCISSPSHPHHIAVLNLKNINYTNLLSVNEDLNQRPWLIVPCGTDLKQTSSRSIKGIQWSIHRMECETLNHELSDINSFEYLLIHPKLENDCSIKQIDISDFTFGKDMSKIIANRLHGLIVIPHGGPHTQSNIAWSSMIASFCICGFACLLINYRGSLGYGNDFTRDLLGFIGDKDVSDCVQATKSALNYLRKYESNLKAVLYGGSHGGFLSLHLAARYNNLYSVAVTRNPVTNLVSMIDTTDIPDWCYTETGLTDWCEWPLHRLPSDSELIRLSNVSPLKYLNQTWSIPLLMLLGGKDRRVPNSQGFTFCRKLKSLCPNIPCEILFYPYDSHPLDSPACSTDIFINSLIWFLKYLNKSELVKY
ncbi:unnamed protein product [Heterobilharzia americana]|nr:unnamed protein product [Heterobilharzia americana]